MDDIFEKYDNNTETYKKANTELCTDAKVSRLLNNIKEGYSDKESLQEMLDETIKLLRQEETDHDKIRIRCREYLKVIENKHNRIKELEYQNRKLEERVNDLENLIRKTIL
jgi:DNA repair exonuclease SbcCD ATPase subunit